MIYTYAWYETPDSSGWDWLFTSVKYNHCTPSASYAVFNSTDENIFFKSKGSQLVMSLIKTFINSESLPESWSAKEAYEYTVRTFQKTFNYWIDKGYITDQAKLKEDAIAGFYTKKAIIADLTRFVNGFNGRMPVRDINSYSMLLH